MTKDAIRHASIAASSVPQIERTLERKFVFFPRALLELQFVVMEIAMATPIFTQAKAQREG